MRLFLPYKIINQTVPVEKRWRGDMWGSCDCLSFKILLGVVCLLVGVLLVTSSLAFKYHNRWKDCRECLLLLRELDKELTERDHRSLRPPSTLAAPPPLPDPSSFKKLCYSSSKAPTSTIITNTASVGRKCSRRTETLLVRGLRC
ncbi:hypothetical protein Pcinc_019315 [Petrolisthes cinctipes]|uniref:Uncharacterized protein n=1 Tax=Petrolisthes cinctipes TaxID=88211 RepID=A0AAE1KMU6_PETCI|nr:hypothetical protein Pcinc_019315 [Petrolisthes cinctipes]